MLVICWSYAGHMLAPSSIKLIIADETLRRSCAANCHFPYHLSKPKKYKTVFFTQFNRESVSQDSFNLLNFNATYKPNNSFELTFYAHNITDEGYITDILESGVVTGQTVPQGILGPPKTYGMKMSINF